MRLRTREGSDAGRGAGVRGVLRNAVLRDARAGEAWADVQGVAREVVA